MAPFEMVDGRLVEIKRLVRVGHSTALVIPSYLLRNLGVFDVAEAQVSIAQEGSKLVVQFFPSEEALVAAMSPAAFDGGDHDQDR